MKPILMLFGLLSALCLSNAMHGQSRWSELGHAGIFNAVPTNIATDMANNVYVAGDFSNTNGARQYHYVAKWDGHTWGELGTGPAVLPFEGWISCLSTDFAGNVYIAGGIHNPATGVCVAKWDGTSWTELGTRNNTLNGNEGIFAMNIDTKGNIYVGGRFTNLSGYRYVSRWNGSYWEELGWGANTFNPDGDIWAIATDTFGNVYVSGDFRNARGEYYVARWDGTAWTELGTPNKPDADGEIFYLCTDNRGNLYAAAWFNGSYRRAGFVAKWDGTTWTDLDTGFNGLNPYRHISALMTDTAGNVYAAGVFLDSTGITSYNVAKWDGVSWALLGRDNSQPMGIISSLAQDADHNIYAVGDIRNSEGRLYVARYGPPTVSVDKLTPVKDDIEVYPNPNKGRLTLSGDWIARNGGHQLKIDIYDVLGRRVPFSSSKSVNHTHAMDIMLDNQVGDGFYQLQIATCETRSAVKFILKR